MKKFFLALIISSAINIASAQDSAKVVNISDNRNKGLYKYQGCDAPTDGFKDGDVSVERILDFGYPNQNDTVSGYRLHFYKMFGDALRNYSMSDMDKKDNDIVSYFWMNAKDVSITLINSQTKKKHTMKLQQAGSTVGFISSDGD
jgi:hypothetical protein